MDAIDNKVAVDIALTLPLAGIERLTMRR